MKKPAIPKVPHIDFSKFDLRAIAEDFKSLDPKDPGAWPLIPRIVVLLALFVVVLFLAAWFGWQEQYRELEAKRQEETKLKNDWLDKKKKAINLDEYRNQLVEIESSFGALLKQLPNAAEMESLLVDINQAGLGRGLSFELFKPAAEVKKEFYAELPITISIVGTYHDLGAFTGDVARLPRIVTLNNLSVAPMKGGQKLLMTGTAKTFRYLSEEEIASSKKAPATKQGAKK